MKPEQHLAVSAVLSGALYGATGSATLGLSSFVAGVAIDADHVLDYVLGYGFRLDPGHFFRSCYRGEWPNAYLLLHAWEWIATLALTAWLSGWNPWIAGAALGAGQHLVLDQLANRARPWGYSILWRGRRGFRHRAVFLGPTFGRLWRARPPAG